MCWLRRLRVHYFDPGSNLDYFETRPNFTPLRFFGFSAPAGKTLLPKSLIEFAPNYPPTIISKHREN